MLCEHTVSTLIYFVYMVCTNVHSTLQCQNIANSRHTTIWCYMVVTSSNNGISSEYYCEVFAEVSEIQKLSH